MPRLAGLSLLLVAQGIKCEAVTTHTQHTELVLHVNVTRCAQYAPSIVLDEATRYPVRVWVPAYISWPCSCPEAIAHCKHIFSHTQPHLYTFPLVSPIHMHTLGFGCFCIYTCKAFGPMHCWQVSLLHIPQVISCTCCKCTESCLCLL